VRPSAAYRRRDGDEREVAAVAVADRTVLIELHHSIGEDRFERRASRKTGLRLRAGFAGGRRERHLNAGKANLASVLEDETASVRDRSNLCRAGGLEPASGERPAFRARGRRRQNDGHARHAAKPRKSDVPAPAHAATKPSEWGGTTARFIGPYLGGPRVALVAAIVVYFAHE